VDGIRFTIRPTEHGLAVLRPLSATRPSQPHAFLLGSGVVGLTGRLEAAACGHGEAWQVFWPASRRLVP
jgi:hypothetical protein